MSEAGAGGTFDHRYRVRFDEAGPDGRLRTSGVLRFAQDVGWIQANALGFDREWYAARGLGWLVRAAELEVLAPIPMGAELEVSTAIVGHRRAWARRRGEIRSAAGALVAWVHTDWVLVDGRGAPTRIPPEFGRAFRSGDAPLTLTRVTSGEAPADATVRVFRVRPQELDANDHPNNAVYVDWLEEAILDAGGAVDGVPRRYRLEYAAAAGPRDELRAAAWRTDDGWAYRLRGPDGSELFRARTRDGHERHADASRRNIL